MSRFWVTSGSRVPCIPPQLSYKISVLNKKNKRILIILQTTTEILNLNGKILNRFINAHKCGVYFFLKIRLHRTLWLLYKSYYPVRKHGIIPKPRSQGLFVALSCTNSSRYKRYHHAAFFSTSKNQIGTWTSQDKNAEKLCHYQRHFIKTKTAKINLGLTKLRYILDFRFLKYISEFYVGARHNCAKMLSNRINWKFVCASSEFHFYLRKQFPRDTITHQILVRIFQE